MILYILHKDRYHLVGYEFSAYFHHIPPIDFSEEDNVWFQMYFLDDDGEYKNKKKQIKNKYMSYLYIYKLLYEGMSPREFFGYHPYLTSFIYVWFVRRNYRRTGKLEMGIYSHRVDVDDIVLIPWNSYPMPIFLFPGERVDSHGRVYK